MNATVPFPSLISSITSNDALRTALAILNHFIDLETFITCLEALVAALVIYYGMSIVLRWLKVIE